MRSVIRKKFDRWKPVERSSWTSQVFKRYNEEIERNIASYILANKYTYQTLGKNGAKWEDKINSHFTSKKTDEKLFEGLKEWSDSFNNFNKWVNINVIMAISSNFETYLASIVLLALKSNPGTLFGSSRSIDGLSILKKGTFDKLDYNKIVETVTKGDWNSRIASFKKIFGNAPIILDAKLSELEQIRKLRNQVGHSFGRDINESRTHSVKKIIELDSISIERVQRYQRILWSCAKDIDEYLLNEHIGNFQFILFYHNLYPKLSIKSHINERANWLKDEIGHSGVASIHKPYYRDLVNYYENL